MEVGGELEGLLGAIKKWTSRRIHQWLRDQPQVIRPARQPQKRSRFWQQESYDRIVRDTEELLAFRRYIARNPKEANVRQGQYVYYAAQWLDSFAPL